MKYSLSHFENDDVDLLCSAIFCLTNAVKNPSYSKDFILKIIWISIYLLMLQQKSVYSFAIKLFDACVTRLDIINLGSSFLLHLEKTYKSFGDATHQLDKTFGLNFKEYIGLSMSLVLSVGVSGTSTREMTEKMVVTLLNICGVRENMLPVSGLIVLMLGSGEYDILEIVPELDDEFTNLFKTLGSISDAHILILLELVLQILELEEYENTMERFLGIIIEGLQLRPKMISQLGNKIVSVLRSLSKVTNNDAVKVKISDLFMLVLNIVDDGKCSDNREQIGKLGFSCFEEPLAFADANKIKELAVQLNCVFDCVLSDEN